MYDNGSYLIYIPKYYVQALEIDNYISFNSLVYINSRTLHCSSYRYTRERFCGTLLIKHTVPSPDTGGREVGNLRRGLSPTEIRVSNSIFYTTTIVFHTALSGLGGAGVDQFKQVQSLQSAMCHDIYQMLMRTCARGAWFMSMSPRTGTFILN